MNALIDLPIASCGEADYREPGNDWNLHCANVITQSRNFAACRAPQPSEIKNR
jgi:hypothetical protein